MERDLTHGSIGRNILRFSLPYFLSYFLQTLYGMADLFIIGQFDSVSGTTAVSIGSQVMHMITVMIVGIAMGTTVMIGKSVGAKLKKETSKIIGNTITLFLGISIVLTCILLFFVNPIVDIMSTPTQAVAGTRAYLMICFAGIPLITAYNIISSIFRGLGDSKSPMYFIAVACFFNIILDYLYWHIPPWCFWSSTWNNSCTNDQRCYRFISNIKKEHRYFCSQRGFETTGSNFKEYFTDWNSYFTSGWIYPNILYYHNDHCKPKRFK